MKFGTTAALIFRATLIASLVAAYGGLAAGALGFLSADTVSFVAVAGAMSAAAAAVGYLYVMDQKLRREV